MTRASAVFAALVAMTLAQSARAQDGGRPRAAVSPIVFPLEHLALRMDHSHPAHRVLACERCHVAARTSRVARDFLVPPESACAPCHDADTTRSAPAAERCGRCHIGYGARGPLDVPRSILPVARLRFSHAAHGARGMVCSDCHEGVRNTTVATRANLPTMRSCLRCHGGAAPSAPTACRTCHLTLPDGRLRTSFAEGTLTPPAWLGMRHDADWLVRHRWVAADDGNACASCHRERDCTDCHDGRVRPPRVHPNDFLTIHPQLARRGAPRCTSCHVTQSFCLECHARLGVSPIAAPLARATTRFHPPESVWVRGGAGGAHAREARRSLESCASCHAERDCIVCHGGLGIGPGTSSPHPPSFRTRCGDLLRANARACVSCHGDLSTLAGRCE